MGRASRSLLGLAVAVAASATVLAVPTGAQASTAHSACDASLVAPEGSLIGGLWRSNGGQSSVYGCPTSKEFGYPDKRGSWQTFRNGKIVWSPNLGNGTLVRVYEKGNKIVFKWSGVGRDWDFFNVRWSKDGGRATQAKVGRLTPWSGQYVMTPYCDGDVCSTTNGHEVNRFAFVVQGCDRGTFSSDCGPWSIPTSIRVAH
ncbi:LGFP repeat-containing protein [Streptosporangium sp. NPDC050855]|uniref:LGFP repeat-containing protein n=1 Tax=Streptosporangium sp. NPDC050855 TaxID=3366194 RepID=UPI00378AD735